MLIFRTVAAIQSWIADQKLTTKSIGFVPTMGALHAGHISLIAQSKSENALTLCSIFVNPTQFNDPADLEKYPRTLESDTKLLVTGGCDVLFYPSVKEIYPTDLPEVKVKLNGLDEVMEGIHRPGHFKGVVQVVYRLLDIVKPHRLYMGQKDFQQFTIIGQMIDDLNLKVKLIVCPIFREENGLAMSSRNARLSDQGKEKAGIIYKTLQEGIAQKNKLSPEEINEYCFQKINHIPFEPEYVEIVNPKTLKPIRNWDESKNYVICAAVWLEGVRLIDNIIFD